MRIGPMQRRITLQQKATGADSFGQPVIAWLDVCTVWAQIRPMQGSELIAAQASQSETTHQITMRWRPNLVLPTQVAAMRVLFGTRTFNIVSVINQHERNTTLVLMASEGLKDG